MSEDGAWGSRGKGAHRTHIEIRLIPAAYRFDACYWKLGMECAMPDDHGRTCGLFF
jgi:hypothetical protein